MKKSIKTFFSISLIFICLLMNTTTAKYVTDIKGIAWYTAFSNFPVIGDIFSVGEEDIKDENGIIKEEVKGPHAWGKDPDGNLDDDSELGGEYTMGQLDEVVMGIYNDTSNQRLLIKFQITCYILENLSKFDFYLVNTSLYENYPTEIPENVQNQPYEGENVYGSFLNSSGGVYTGPGEIDNGVYRAPLIKQDDSVAVPIIFWSLTYYQHIGIIDPSIMLDKETLESEFVVNPNQSREFHLRTKFQEQILGEWWAPEDSYYSCYASINLIAVPYNG